MSPGCDSSKLAMVTPDLTVEALQLDDSRANRGVMNRRPPDQTWAGDSRSRFAPATADANGGDHRCNCGNDPLDFVPSAHVGPHRDRRQGRSGRRDTTMARTSPTSAEPTRTSRRARVRIRQKHCGCATTRGSREARSERRRRTDVVQTCIVVSRGGCTASLSAPLLHEWCPENMVGHRARRRSCSWPGTPRGRLLQCATR
jgi:hypothetical protein